MVVLILINCISINVLLWYLTLKYILPILKLNLNTIAPPSSVKKEKIIENKYSRFVENGVVDEKKVDNDFWD